MVSGNHFPENGRVWQLRKIEFSENDFSLTEILLLWPGNGFTLSFYLQTVSGSHAKERESKRKREREKERRESRDRPKPSLPISSVDITGIAPITRSVDLDRDCTKLRLRSREASTAPIAISPTSPALRRSLEALMIFFWVLFVFWGMNDIIYLFGNQENARKCEQQVENVFSMVFSRTQPNIRKYFSKHFLKCNQIHENIFLFGK